MLTPLVILFVDLFVVISVVHFHVAVLVVCFCTVGARTRVSSSLTYAPAALATCSDLRSLANLSGTIPPEIGGMTNLTYLLLVIAAVVSCGVFYRRCDAHVCLSSAFDAHSLSCFIC